MRLRWMSRRWRLLHQRQRLLCPSNNRLAVLHRTVFSHHRIGRALPTPAAWLLWPLHHLRPTTPSTTTSITNYPHRHLSTDPTTSWHTSLQLRTTSPTLQRSTRSRGVPTTKSTTNYTHPRAQLQPTSSRPTFRPTDATLRLTTSSPTSFRGSQLLLLQPYITTPHNPVHQLDGHYPTTHSTRSSTTICQRWTTRQLLPRLREPHDFQQR